MDLRKDIAYWDYSDHAGGKQLKAAGQEPRQQGKGEL